MLACRLPKKLLRKDVSAARTRTAATRHRPKNARLEFLRWDRRPWRGSARVSHERIKEKCLSLRQGASGELNPIIQFPDNSQSLNPYSYILNNPLSGTDPTGYACVAATGSNIKTCETVTVTATTTDGKTTTATRQMNAGTVERYAAARGGNGATGANRSDNNRQDAAKGNNAKAAGGENNANRGSTEPPRWGSMTDAQAEEVADGMSRSMVRAFVPPVDAVMSFLEDMGEGRYFRAALGVGIPKLRSGMQIAGPLGDLSKLEGKFSISDWTGYPKGLPKPDGPFRLL